MSQEKIVTLFNSPAIARHAVTELIEADFAEHDIQYLDREYLKEREQAIQEKNIWDELFGYDVMEENVDIYRHAIENDAVILILLTENTLLDKAMQILEHYHQLDKSKLPEGAKDVSIAPALQGSPNQSNPTTTVHR
ncbi:hypothetical protein [Entomomonas asaccharolytica]|uniref:Uncharacterized protein n=1 Tax=Entomomonas asaccharolytica TaxID=2785331 RepID=A0A974NF49_9GAMM|nr:hypothetical protein [Entomomonas asaccharolytica]QQP85646.1 hypothetical protein JHT90_14960 [Entomomonas asaccharolytica]